MSLFGRTRQFSRSLESNWGRLYRVAYAWTHDAFIAHDLVQETMARTLQNKDKITDSTALEIWLFKVMANYWRDLLRSRKDIMDIDSAQLIAEDTPDEATERSRLVMQVRQAISQLNQNQRQVITLVVLEDLSYENVASILDIPVGTVMSRLCRARQTLKQLLGKTGSTYFSTDRVRRMT